VERVTNPDPICTDLETAQRWVELGIAKIKSDIHYFGALPGAGISLSLEPLTILPENSNQTLSIDVTSFLEKEKLDPQISYHIEIFKDKNFVGREMYADDDGKFSITLVPSEKRCADTKLWNCTEFIGEFKRIPPSVYYGDSEIHSPAFGKASELRVAFTLYQTVPVTQGPSTSYSMNSIEGRTFSFTVSEDLPQNDEKVEELEPMQEGSRVPGSEVQCQEGFICYENLSGGLGPSGGLPIESMGGDKLCHKECVIDSDCPANAPMCILKDRITEDYSEGFYLCVTEDKGNSIREPKFESCLVSKEKELQEAIDQDGIIRVRGDPLGPHKADFNGVRIDFLPNVASDLNFGERKSMMFYEYGFNTIRSQGGIYGSLIVYYPFNDTFRILCELEQDNRIYKTGFNIDWLPFEQGYLSPQKQSSFSSQENLSPRELTADEKDFESCTTGNYSRSHGLGSWSISIQRSEDGKCFMEWIDEIEGGYTKSFCVFRIGDYNASNWDTELTYPFTHPNLNLSMRASSNPCLLIETGNVFWTDFQVHSSPNLQIEFGVLPSDITCKQGLELIFKSSDKSPACVKSSTAQKLLVREWRVLGYYD